MATSVLSLGLVSIQRRPRGVRVGRWSRLQFSEAQAERRTRGRAPHPSLIPPLGAVCHLTPCSAWGPQCHLRGYGSTVTWLRGVRRGTGAGPLELPLTPTHISVPLVVLRAPRALASCRALGCIPLGFRSVNRLCAGPPHRWRRGPLLQLPLTHLLLIFHTFGVPVSHRLLSPPSSLCPPGFLRFRDLALKVRSWVRPAVLDLLHFRGEVSCESSQTRATVCHSHEWDGLDPRSGNSAPVRPTFVQCSL